MIRQSLYDYRNAYMLVSGTITIAEAGADDLAKQKYKNQKWEIFKKFAPFNKFISEINNT